MNNQESLNQLAKGFRECQDLLTAIGDETRQLIIISLMEGGCEPGIRVGEITKKTNLSRPAVSHHLKILKEANIVSVNRQGTMNYYYLDATKSKLLKLKRLFDEIQTLMISCCNGKGEE